MVQHKTKGSKEHQKGKASDIAKEKAGGEDVGSSSSEHSIAPGAPTSAARGEQPEEGVSQAAGRAKKFLSSWGVTVSKNEWFRLWQDKTIARVRLRQHEDMLKAFVDKGGAERWRTPEDARSWAQQFFHEPVSAAGTLPRIEEKFKGSRVAQRLKRQAEAAGGLRHDDEEETEGPDSVSSGTTVKRPRKAPKSVQGQGILRGKQRVPEWDLVARRWWEMCQSKGDYADKFKRDGSDLPLNELCLFTVPDAEEQITPGWCPALDSELFDFVPQSHRHKFILRSGSFLMNDNVRLVGNDDQYWVNDVGKLVRKESYLRRAKSETYSLLHESYGLNRDGDVNVEFYSRNVDGRPDNLTAEGDLKRAKVWFLPGSKPLPDSMKGTYVIWLSAKKPKETVRAEKRGKGGASSKNK